MRPLVPIVALVATGLVAHAIPVFDVLPSFVDAQAIESERSQDSGWLSKWLALGGEGEVAVRVSRAHGQAVSEFATRSSAAGFTNRVSISDHSLTGSSSTTPFSSLIAPPLSPPSSRPSHYHSLAA
jgi:hypothetical protein